MRPPPVSARAARHLAEEGDPPPVQLVAFFQPAERGEDPLAVLVVANRGSAFGDFEVLPKLHGVGLDLRAEVDKQFVDDVEAPRDGSFRAILSALDAFGDPDLSFPVEERNHTHFAEIHPHRVVRALDGARRQIEGGAVGVLGLFVFLFGFEERDAPFRQALEEFFGRIVAPSLLNLFSEEIAAILSERHERLDLIGLGLDAEITEQCQVVPGGFRLLHGWSSGRILWIGPQTVPASGLSAGRRERTGAESVRNGSARVRSFSAGAPKSAGPSIDPGALSAEELLRRFRTGDSRRERTASARKFKSAQRFCRTFSGAATPNSNPAL